MRTHVFAADTENELAQLPAVLPLAHSPEFARPPAGVARPVLVNGGSSGSGGHRFDSYLPFCSGSD